MRRLPAAVRGPLVATAAIGLCLLLAGQAGGAAQPPLSVSAPFTLASGVTYGLGAGASTVGPDGTVWLAQPVSPSGGFEVMARTASGLAMRVGFAAGSSGAAYSRPAIATTAGSATFVWESASDAGGPSGTTTVTALRCTLIGCKPTQALASWHWTHANDSFPPMGYQARPAVASAGGETVAVFLRDEPARPRMVWVQAGSGRFGAPRDFGRSGAAAPVLAGEGHGRIVAAWLAGGGDTASGSGIDWASWSEQAGFTPVRRLTGAHGVYAAGLVGTQTEAGAAIAWIQGDNETDPGLAAEPVWVARPSSTGFAKPVRAFAGFGFGLSLAANDGVLALGFSETRRAGLDGGAAGPAMIERSDAGAPFAAPVTLDPDAAPGPAVAVGAGGDVLAAWDDGGARVAIATNTGPFSSPLPIGPELGEDSPAIHLSGTRALVTWQGPAATGTVFGAFATARESERAGAQSALPAGR